MVNKKLPKTRTSEPDASAVEAGPEADPDPDPIDEQCGRTPEAGKRPVLSL
jgi:hypothetical protein